MPHTIRSVGVGAIVVTAMVACASQNERAGGLIDPDRSGEEAVAVFEATGGRAAAFDAELAAAHAQERRDEGWAERQEAELRETFGAIAQTVVVDLQTLECKSTLCAITIELPRQGDTVPMALFAVEDWISRSQPCAYTMVAPTEQQGLPATARIHLDCGPLSREQLAR